MISTKVLSHRNFEKSRKMSAEVGIVDFIQLLGLALAGKISDSFIKWAFFGPDNENG